jgi:WD40 repeat protein
VRKLTSHILLQDGTKILSGGADKAGRMYDVATGQSSQVAAHDAPIKSIRYVDQQGGILATGSWDKTLKVSRKGKGRRFDSDLALTCLVNSVHCSTGICARQMLLRRHNWLNDAIQWTPTGLMWSLLLQRERYSSLTCLRIPAMQSW